MLTAHGDLSGTQFSASVNGDTRTNTEDSESDLGLDYLVAERCFGGDRFGYECAVPRGRTH